MNYHINLKEIEKTASKISQGLQGGDILALIGPLGSGKTTFTKALAKNLNIKQTIPSPTFTILQHFKGAHPVNRKVLHLYHLDLYRPRK
jgi:tRNA threonylcarbamoyladenosine biosynthesis protein TsaE